MILRCGKSAFRIDYRVAVLYLNPRASTASTIYNDDRCNYENGVKVQVFNEEIECKCAEETDV